jgi:hypothetical protein
MWTFKPGIWFSFVVFNQEQLTHHISTQFVNIILIHNVNHNGHKVGPQLLQVQLYNLCSIDRDPWIDVELIFVVKVGFFFLRGFVVIILFEYSKLMV